MNSKMDEQKHSPQISELVDRLIHLAMQWRGMPDDRQRIKAEYHLIMKTLYSLGWDDILDIDSELPDEDMPNEYTSRHPYVPPSRWPKKKI